MVEIDDRRWPIVCTTFRGTMTPEDVELVLASAARFLARGRYAEVVIAEGVRSIDAKVMRRQAAWVKENEARIRQQSVGIALVLDSPLARGMLRAFLWIQPLPQPHAVCASAAEAISWVRTRLAAEGLKIPATAA